MRVCDAYADPSYTLTEYLNIPMGQFCIYFMLLFQNKLKILKLYFVTIIKTFLMKTKVSVKRFVVSWL